MVMRDRPGANAGDDVTVGGFKHRPWSSIPVEEVMRRHVLTCHADATMREVARIMVTHSVHAVVVVDGDTAGEPTVSGIVTALELAIAAVENTEPTAGELANPHAATVAVGSTLEQAARAILRTGGAHVIVVDGRSAPIGMLSTLDLARITAWGHA